MKIDVINKDMKKISELELNQSIWEITPNKTLQFDSLLKYNAGQRQGTHKVKSRGEVSGGGRKPWKQKKTGNARQGSIRSPQWKGGGIVFGPTVERNYKLKLNKKQSNLAIKSALVAKFHNNNIIVIEKFSFEKPATKEMYQLLTGLQLNNKKVLVITNPENQAIVSKSGRNIPKLTIISSASLNIYDLLNNEKILITLSAINKIEESWGKCI